MAMFNNREIAAGIWLLAAFLYVMKSRGMRQSVAALTRTFFNVKVLVPILLMLLYVAISVVLLTIIGMWKFYLLKDTVIWFGCALAMMVQIVTADRTEHLFRNITADSIKFVILLEFVVNTYTFSLPIELIIIPLLTIVAMWEAIAERKEGYDKVLKLLKNVQVLFGFVILANVVIGLVGGIQELINSNTVREIALAPLLTLVILPCIYAMLLYSKYETIFLRLEIGREKEEDVRRYARHRIIVYAGVSVTRLQNILNKHATDLMHMQSKEDVDNFIDKLKCNAKTRDEVGL